MIGVGFAREVANARCGTRCSEGEADGRRHRDRLLVPLRACPWHVMARDSKTGSAVEAPRRGKAAEKGWKKDLVVKHSPR